MTLKQKFPIEDGWLHLKLTLTSGTAFTEEDLRKYISLFGGEDSEIAHIDVSRNPVVAVYRNKKITDRVPEHGTAKVKSLP